MPTPACHARESDTEQSEFARLIDDHQRMVWRYLRMLGAEPPEAEDLMQETFLRVVDQVGRGRTLRAPGAFLRTVARNLLVSRRRGAQLRPPTVAWTDAVDGLLASEPEALDDERLDVLRACLGRLPDRARQAVELHHVDGLTYREVGKHLGLRTNGLRALLHRARLLLRECMQRALHTSEPEDE